MSADIDVDFQDRGKPLGFLPHILALMNHNGQDVKHNTGVYFQNIPTNPLSGIASIPYKKADALGYFKIDFINNTVYENVQDENHLIQLMNTEPPWEMLEEADFVEMLAHIHSHKDIVDVIKPKSVEDLAVVLALIRPGKRSLMYLDRNEIDAKIWEPPQDGSYHFKKSHSVAYAVSIVVQMNLLIELGEQE
jgi:hypothetical protein